MTSATFDPTQWQDGLDDLLRQLPDADVADQLKTSAAGILRAHLRQSQNAPLDLLSADDILNTDWPEPTWAIPELLPVGLCILAGKPKVGKSWMALDVARAVAAGGVILDQQVKSGPVLYLALEDTPRRLADRMKMQCWSAGLPADFMPMGEFTDQVGDLENGGGERLARQIEDRGYRLAVIDTLSRSIGQGDQDNVTAMTVALEPLQRIAHDYNCVVILIDHHRKSSGFDRDAITDILGSTAKGAMCDTAWGLYRERGKSGARLAITGRDVDEKTLNLSFNPLIGSWEVRGVNITEKQEEILVIVEDIGPATLKDITDLSGRNKGSVYKDLQELVKKKRVKPNGTGQGKTYEIL